MLKLLILNVIIMVLVVSVRSQTCLGGIWDITSNIWYTDCTGDEYDGRYMDYSGNPATTVSDDTIISLGDGSTQHIYWRLYWFSGSASNALPVPDSIPLLAGVHCWSEGSSLTQLLDAGNTGIEYDPAAERVISLTFSINASFNNSGTWWWGKMVNGVPTSWAEDIIIKIIRQRIQDAPQILANAGATALNGKHIDQNRVYLRGHSMGGTGAYRIGIKYPDIFAALHCHAGFADFKGPCGAFTGDFDAMVGTSGQQCRGLDGNFYNARDYTDMSWFVRTHKGVSWETMVGTGAQYEPPYVCMTHGSSDDAVDIASADRIHHTLDSLKFGCSYNRHTGGHSDGVFTRTAWLLSLRKNQSYLAFTNNSSDDAYHYNFLDRIGWRPSSIVDEVNHYEVQLTGSSGTVSVTPRRLQNFIVTPGKAFHYWIGTQTGLGTAVTANNAGALTVPSVSAGSKIIIEPDVFSSVERGGSAAALTVDAVPNPFNPAVTISVRAGCNQPSRVGIYSVSGRFVGEIAMKDGLCIWDASHQPSGTYVVMVYVGATMYSKTITLIK